MAYFKCRGNLFIIKKNYILYYTHQNQVNPNNVGLQHIKPMTFSKFKVPRFFFLSFPPFSRNPNRTKEYVYGEREFVTKARDIYIIASIHNQAEISQEKINK